jgi:hypothetical protein
MIDSMIELHLADEIQIGDWICFDVEPDWREVSSIRQTRGGLLSLRALNDPRLPSAGTIGRWSEPTDLVEVRR